MSLGKRTMSIGMKVSWAIAKRTGKSIQEVSSVVLKLVWRVFGGAKK